MGLDGNDLKGLIDIIQSKVGDGADVQVFAVSEGEMEAVKDIDDLKRLVREKGGHFGEDSEFEVAKEQGDISKRMRIAEMMGEILHGEEASVSDFFHAGMALLSSRLYPVYKDETGENEEGYSKYLQEVANSIAAAMIKVKPVKLYRVEDMALGLMLTGMKLLDVDNHMASKQPEPTVDQKAADRKAFIAELKKALDDLL